MNESIIEPILYNVRTNFDNEKKKHEGSKEKTETVESK